MQQREFDAWSRIRRDGNPAAYARTTLVRLHIDSRRRRRREVLTDAVPEMVGVEAAEAAVGGLDAWVLAALAELTPRQRTAVLLRHLDDLDLASIAEVMSCSTGTAKSHLSRGMERLRAHVPAAGLSEEDRHG
ncbi:sigma-70 family RNA polymerase sigma factor [Pimelobacter simplex]|uniref:sigma-70 family RNA polymerase sigma factor n=1 Tax=Nocardioides simplex TaxID=2045 RepID=UPI003AAE9870